MPPGRKKKKRCLEIDFQAMVCKIFGPLLGKKSFDPNNTISVACDEFQTIVYQDLHNLTMQEAANKMGISKTVYAGLYASARKKIATALFCNKTLTLGCDGSDFESTD